MTKKIIITRGTGKAGSKGFKSTKGGAYGDGVYFYGGLKGSLQARSYCTYPGGVVWTAFLNTKYLNGIDAFRVVIKEKGWFNNIITKTIVVVKNPKIIDVRGKIPLKDTNLTGKKWESRVRKALREKHK